MREVLPALMAARRARRAGGDGHRGAHVALGAASCRCLDARHRGRRGGRLGQRRLRRGRAVHAGHRGARRRRRALRDVRDQRRRRVRGRAHLRRHPRGVRREGRRADLARAARDRGVSIAGEEPVAVATIVKGRDHVGRHLVVRANGIEGSLGTSRLDDTVGADVLGMLESGTTGFLHYGPEGERLGEGLEVFVASFAPAPRMAIFGAIDFSAALEQGRQAARLPRDRRRRARGVRDAEAVPGRRRGRRRLAAPLAGVAAGRLAHGDLRADARPEVRRAGAEGGGARRGRRTSVRWDRGARTRIALVRLKEAGLTDEEIARIHSPIGLDLGARTPEETAISIAAEIVQARWGGSGRKLAQSDGPIHAGAPR